MYIYMYIYLHICLSFRLSTSTTFFHGLKALIARCFDTILSLLRLIGLPNRCRPLGLAVDNHVELMGKWSGGAARSDGGDGIGGIVVGNL